MKTRPRVMRTVAVLGLVVATASACSTRKHYGVATHTDTVKGSCNTSRTVEVGAALDLTGPAAATNGAYLTGLRMGVGQSNDAQGILKNHSCLELLYKDDSGNTHVGDKAVLDLVDNEVVSFLVAPTDPSVLSFTGADLGLAGVPTTSFSSLDTTYQPAKYPQTFPVAASERVQTQVMAAFVASKGWKTVGLAYVNDPAGSDGAADFRSAAGSRGLTVVGSTAVQPGRTPDLSPLRSAAPEALVVVGDAPQTTRILAARSAAAWDVPVVGDMSLADGDAGPDASGVNVVVPRAVVAPAGAANPTDPSVGQFRDKLLKALHETSFAGSIVPYAQAYDGVKMMAYVASSVNSTIPGNVRTFLENANYQGLLASYNYTSSAHTGIGADQLTVARLGSLADGFFHTP